MQEMQYSFLPEITTNLIDQLPEVIPASAETKKTCRTPLQKRIPSLKASREIRNSQTLQQSLCICLLSQFCDITIKQPARKSVVTQQYMRLKTLDFGNGEEISVGDYLKTRCLDMKNDDLTHVSEKTATRRYQNNKRIELLHLLIDLLMIRGDYEFETKTVYGKMKTNKLETILAVYRDGKCVVKEDELNKKAETINSYLVAKMAQTTKEFVIPKGDAIINILFDDNSSF